MRVLFFLVRSSRLIVALAVAVGLASGGASSGLLMVTNRLIAQGIGSGGSGGEPGKLLLLFAALFFAVPATQVLSQWLLVRLGQGAIQELRLRLARCILATPLRRLEEIGQHRLLVALTDDVYNISSVLVLIPVFTINIAILLSCLCYVGWLSPSLLAGLAAMLIFGVITYNLPMAAAWRLFGRVREVQESLFSHFRGLVSGIKELKLHGRRRHRFLSMLWDTGEDYRRYEVRSLTILAAAASWGHTLFFLAIALLLFVVPGAGDFSTEAVVGTILVLLFLMAPLQNLLNSVPLLGRGNAALARIETLGLSLTAAEEVPAELPADHLPAPGVGGIELRGVRHTYHRPGDDRDFTLGPLDFHLGPGELVFLVGGNGSGKTTLAKIVTGLYAAEVGEIRLAGRTLGEGERELHRNHFSVVFADFYLFDRLLGLEAPELDARARSYLERLELADKVQIDGHRFSTLELSQGQRKRLALLVAFLEDRPFYVFDEWAADQDPSFREIFYRGILPELKAKGKGVLVISHDDRYYSLADRVVRLDYGQVSPEHLHPASPAT